MSPDPGAGDGNPMMNQIGDPDSIGNGQAIVVPYLTPVPCGNTTVHAGNSLVATVSIATGEVDNATDHMTVLELSADHGQLVAYDMARSRLVTQAQLGVDLATAGATHIGTANFVTTTTHDGKLTISRVTDELRDVREDSRFEGLELAANPIVNGPGNTFTVPSIGAEGDLHITTLGPDLEVQSTKHLTDAVGFQGVAAANYGSTAMIAWSTSDRCNLQFAGAELPTDGSHLTVACPNPQLAVDAHGQAVVAYMAPKGVMVARAPGQQFVEEQLVGGGGRDPHLAFDGDRVWLTYVDNRDQLVIGFFEADGHFSSATMYAMRTANTTFQVTAYGGGVMLLGATPEGFTTNNFCKASR